MYLNFRAKIWPKFAVKTRTFFCCFLHSICGQSIILYFLNWLLRFPDLFSGGWMTWKYFLFCLGMFEYFYLCLESQMKNPFDITLIWIHGEFSQTTDWFFPAAGPSSPLILLGQNCLQSYRCHHPKLYIIVLCRHSTCCEMTHLSFSPPKMSLTTAWKSSSKKTIWINGQKSYLIYADFFVPKLIWIFAPKVIK